MYLYVLVLTSPIFAAIYLLKQSSSLDSIFNLYCIFLFLFCSPLSPIWDEPPEAVTLLGLQCYLQDSAILSSKKLCQLVLRKSCGSKSQVLLGLHLDWEGAEMGNMHKKKYIIYVIQILTDFWSKYTYTLWILENIQYTLVLKSIKSLKV